MSKVLILISLICLVGCGGQMVTFQTDPMTGEVKVTKQSEKDYYKQKGISR